MMLAAVVVLLLWSLLGASLMRLSGRDQSIEALNGSELFLGMGLVLHSMNLLQCLSGSIVLLLLLAPLLVTSVPVMWNKVKSLPRNHWLLLGIMAVVYLLYVLFMRPDLPMIAWDSWLGWEFKAKQWLSHGFSVNMVSSVQWLSDEVAIFNVTAEYPDGLPLLYYLGQLLGDEHNQVMGYLYGLCYFWLVYLLLLRLKLQGAGWAVCAWGALLFLTLPLLNNHMNLQGYADIWMAMLLLLCVLSLSDWNQRSTFANALRLVVLLSMLPLFKTEGWVWLGLLLLAQFASKFLIRRHRWYVLGFLAAFILLWFAADDWMFSWASRSVVISQSFIKLGNIFELSLMPAAVSHEIFAGLFLQNNWGWLWYFLPFVLLFWLLVKHPKYQQVSQTFFVLSFVAFLLLFFFTDASKWAQNYTAVNRIVLQLAPVFAYLVMQVFVVWKQKRVGEPTLESK